MSSNNPPHSIEAERAIIGALLLDVAAWDKIADVITSNDFYVTTHKIIFDAITKIKNKQVFIDYLIVSEELKNSGKLEEIGGDIYLFNVQSLTPSAINIVSYAEVVKRCSTLRNIISFANETMEYATSPMSSEISEILDNIERRMFTIATGNKKQDTPKRIGDVLSAAMLKLDSTASGIKSGFNILDKLTGGFQPSELTIIAGRPSMGKSAFALNIASNIAQNEKKAVLFFSLEMSAESLSLRLLSGASNVPHSKIKNGDLNDKDWEQIRDAFNKLVDVPISIENTATLMPSELRTKSRRFIRQVQGGVSCIIIDYIQLMHVYRQDNRVLEIANISHNLKALANELAIPVIALSQLNRGLEQRENKRPVLSDLRDSGALEQDADLILFIHRESLYNKETDSKEAEIIIGKNRNGPVGVCKLNFEGEFARFTNVSSECKYKDWI